MSAEQIWLGVGLAGQALFTARFLVQWIATERMKQSVVPAAFWYFSIGGGVTLLLYAIYRLDPVFIIGQAAGLVVYARNLYFIRRPGDHRLGGHGVAAVPESRDPPRPLS